MLPIMNRLFANNQVSGHNAHLPDYICSDLPRCLCAARAELCRGFYVCHLLQDHRHCAYVEAVGHQQVFAVPLDYAELYRLSPR